MTENIAQQFLEVLTDLNRLAYDNNDPMRYSKLKARMLGLQILSEAVSRAREMVAMVTNIETDHKESTATQGKI